MYAKKDGRSISERNFRIFKKPIYKVVEKSKEIEDIADFCGVHWTAVYKWIRIYKEKGVEGLKRRKAKGAEPKLNKDDKKQIISWLKNLQLSSDLRPHYGIAKEFKG